MRAALYYSVRRASQIGRKVAHKWRKQMGLIGFTDLTVEICRKEVLIGLEEKWAGTGIWRRKKPRGQAGGQLCERSARLHRGCCVARMRIAGQSWGEGPTPRQRWCSFSGVLCSACVCRNTGVYRASSALPMRTSIGWASSQASSSWHHDFYLAPEDVPRVLGRGKGVLLCVRCKRAGCVDFCCVLLRFVVWCKSQENSESCWIKARKKGLRAACGAGAAVPAHSAGLAAGPSSALLTAPMLPFPALHPRFVPEGVGQGCSQSLAPLPQQAPLCLCACSKHPTDFLSLARCDCDRYCSAVLPLLLLEMSALYGKYQKCHNLAVNLFQLYLWRNPSPGKESYIYGYVCVFVRDSCFHGWSDLDLLTHIIQALFTQAFLGNAKPWDPYKKFSKKTVTPNLTENINGSKIVGAVVSQDKAAGT